MAQNICETFYYKINELKVYIKLKCMYFDLTKDQKFMAKFPKLLKKK